MRDMARGNVEDDDFDFAPNDFYWDKVVASDLSTVRDALKFAHGLPSEKRADFWRDNPWKKQKPVKGKGDGKRKKAKPRVTPTKPVTEPASAPESTETPIPTSEPIGPPLEPDKAAMRAHLEWLAAPARDLDSTRCHDLLIEIAFDHGGDGDPNRAQLFDITSAGLDAAANLAAGVNGNDPYCGCNVYVGVCLKKPKTPRGHRTNGGHSCIITAMPADIDHDAEESNAKLAAIATPELTVTTGTVPELRQQKWCRLAKPCTDMPLVKYSFETVVEHIGGDTNATGLNRLMRLAGSVSRPSPKKQARGYVPELTTLSVDPNAPPVDIQVFADLKPRDQPREPREPRSPRHGSSNGTVDEVARLGLSLNDLDALVMDIPNDGGDDNSPDYADWLRVGAGIHHETGGSQDGLRVVRQMVGEASQLRRQENAQDL